MKQNDIIRLYQNDLNVLSVVSCLKTNKKDIIIKGLSGDLSVIVPVAISKNDNKNHCFILENKKSAMVFYSSLSRLVKKEKIYFFPYSHRKAYGGGGDVNNANVVFRTEAIEAIARKTKEKKYLITYPEGLFEKTTNTKTKNKLSLIIKKGQDLDYTFLTNHLNEQSFKHVDFVKEPGQYSLRGNVVDVFSFTNKQPIRLEFNENKIIKIKLFNIESQLTIEERKEIKILANIEKQAQNTPFVSLFSLLNKNWLLWFENISLSANIIEKKYNEALEVYTSLKKTSNVLISKSPKNLFCSKVLFIKEIKTFQKIEFGKSFNKKGVFFKFNSSPQPSFNKNLSLLVENIKSLEEKNYTILISFQSEEQNNRLNTYFDSISYESFYTPIMIALGSGFIDHNNKRAVYTDHQIFNRYYKHTKQPIVVRKQKNPIKKRSELTVGDYLVHIDHGIGRFVGLDKILVNKTKQEVLRVIYKNNDFLYINVNSLHKISKYSGVNTSPALHSLGTQEWEKKKKKIKSKLINITEGLTKLYAKRRNKLGFSFEKDSFMQVELESSFIYQDTPDQLKATIDVKKDMEKKHPMDRLICGDVGFGKTEIAIRAAFKAVASNKQVLILVPTTILALQHYKTFKKRLKDFPVEIDYLSRFRSKKNANEIIKKCENGKVDIIIGTHLVVNNKIKYKNLGLLIVDEEQKFGVSLKEKIKKRKNNLDTLTLTATPIPRTLHFSLIGVRDISIIKTPPTNRQAVYTETISFNKETIRDIIKNELIRFGQVFFVHNRIKDIYEVGNIIQKLVPSARIAVAHGQQKGNNLEKTMLKFIEGFFDVLVSTNIIESGLDIPNANTIIINQAHMFGLSDLHQMRGRVGRSNKKAFCYLITPTLLSLSSDAKRRLIALEEFSMLGDGLNIALKDLDIRGAGNLLGGEQSGFINDLGFETYHKILDEALLELNQPKTKEQSKNLSVFKENNTCFVDVDTEVYIPKNYITNSNERLKMYAFLEKNTEKGLFSKTKKTFKDRFGKIPKNLKNLFLVMEIKKLGSLMAIDKITNKNNKLTLSFNKKSKQNERKNITIQEIFNFTKREEKNITLKETKKQLIVTFKLIFGLKESLVLLKKIKK